MFTKEEYLEWRNHPVHDAYLEEVLEMIDQALTSLGNYAGENPLADRKLVGKIEALKFLADWKPTVTDEDEPNES